MGGWIVECDGELVTMPIEGDWVVPDLEGKLPDSVLLTTDEERFKRGFKAHAVWTHGAGEYATLAYCRELTIQRHATLEQAIRAKQAIDGGGCSGACVKVHILVHIDPTNSRKARELANIRNYRNAQQGEA